MRTYGRVTDPSTKQRFWVEVTEDARGFKDSIYCTALIQVLKLNYNESPFYADWGIPAHPSVVQQIAPDFYVTLTQQRFSPFFLSLIINRVPTPVTPTYSVAVIFHNGASDVLTIPIILTDGFGNVEVDGFGNPIQIGFLSGAFIAQ